MQPAAKYKLYAVYTAGDRGGFGLRRQVLPRRRRAVNNRLVSIATPQPICSIAAAVYMYYTHNASPYTPPRARTQRPLQSFRCSVIIIVVYIHYSPYRPTPPRERRKRTHAHTRNISCSNGFRCVRVAVVAVKNTTYKRSSKRTRFSDVRSLGFPATPSPPIAIAPSPWTVSCSPTLFFFRAVTFRARGC